MLVASCPLREALEGGSRGIWREKFAAGRSRCIVVGEVRPRAHPETKMLNSRWTRALSVTAATLALATAPTEARAGEGVGVLVIKEHGVGGAAQAQPFIDKLVAVVATLNGWASGVGKYVTTRDAAEEYIHSQDPHFGIMSLAAFLGMGQRHKLEIVGQAEVSQEGGREYHVISKNQADLAACKGKTLASDHADDPRFIEKVVARGAFALADFQVVATKRPVQTLKKVTAGEAECALIDDAQLAELKRIEGGAAVKSVWKSDKLPPMVIVAFPSAPAAERAAFGRNLSKVCEGAGKTTCQEAGLAALRPASAADYAAVTSLYSK